MDKLPPTEHEESDQDFEYEYDPIQTETFFVDLDLTTANGGRREPLKRKKPGADHNHHYANGAETMGPPPRTISASPAQGDADAQPGNDPGDEFDGNQDPKTPADPSMATIPPPPPPAKDIQILDLQSNNPVISYQNQIYHCTWSDTVGTLMFFARTEDGVVPNEEALLSTHGYDLIDTSRIKLIGQKAKLTGKPGRKRRKVARKHNDDHQSDDGGSAIAGGDNNDREGEEQEDEPEHDNNESDNDNDDATTIADREADFILNGKSLGEIRTANAKINTDIKKQAAFLEKLMDVKRSKGETDNVRTVFSQRKVKAEGKAAGVGVGVEDEGKRTQPPTTTVTDVDADISRSERQGEKGQDRQDHQMMMPDDDGEEENEKNEKNAKEENKQTAQSTAREIERLNRMVVRGDATALKQLQDIYAERGG